MQNSYTHTSTNILTDVHYQPHVPRDTFPQAESLTWALKPVAYVFIAMNNLVTANVFNMSYAPGIILSVLWALYHSSLTLDIEGRYYYYSKF